MSELVNALARLVRQPRNTSDRALDSWIRDALREEALAHPPAAAWDRLRMAVADRHLKNYGMWVLDEPQRDPPESLPMAMTYHQFERAQRIYLHSRQRAIRPIKGTVWGGMMPILATFVNW
jgi:hypothetical protein